MGKVVMYSSVSVDGFIADENDQPGPLFDWLSSGDVPLDESGELKVSQTSYDYTRCTSTSINALNASASSSPRRSGKVKGRAATAATSTLKPRPPTASPSARSQRLV